MSLTNRGGLFLVTNMIEVIYAYKIFRINVSLTNVWGNFKILFALLATKFFTENYIAS